MEVKIDYKPNKKQAIFHTSDEIEVLFGGAKGGGKSLALVMETLAYALENPGCLCVLFRRTYDDLEANLIREWKRFVPKELYTYHASKHIAFLKNGSEVQFRYIDSIDTADKYQGRSFDYIGVDEITLIEWEAIRILLSCLRSARGFPVRFRCTANPGGVSHVEIKQRFITPTAYGEKPYNDHITGNSIRFVPANVYDNDVLMKNDPAYVRRLENLPEEQRRAFLLGDWDVFQGMALEKFNTAIHVCKPFKIPDWWRKFISVDNGYTDSFYWAFFAISPTGQLYLYREFTRRSDEPKLTYKQQAEKVVELITYSEIENGRVVEKQEKIDYIVIGHDAWQRHPTTRTIDTPQGKSILDFYEEGGLTGFIKPITDRKLRYATWLEYLEPYKDQTGNLTSKLQIFNTCEYLIETLPLQQLDEKDVEKVADSNIDHGYDGAGYGIISYHVDKSKLPSSKKTGIGKYKDELVKKVKRFNKKLN